MNRVKRDPTKLTPLRRALHDAIRAKGVSEAYLSRLVRGNGYFINKYLWNNNPQELRIDEGVKLAEELGIDPQKILGKRAALLTGTAKTRVIKDHKGVGSEIGAENKRMNVIYDVAVEALSKLSPEDMIKAISDATDLSAQRNKQRNPQSREIMS